jgi:arylsulfatase A-like enzyme
MPAEVENPQRALEPPDVLLIVLDCVRASDFPGGGPDPVSMPFIEHLRRESVLFPRAASVAPWTLPSHASVFTGLYPWEHACHGHASLRLDPRIERLAAIVGQEGYRSLSLSGNPIVSPLYGLVDGFDVAEWGEWWEQVQRWKSAPSHRYDAGGRGNALEVPALSFRDRTGRALKTMLTRLPSTIAMGDAVVRRIVDPEQRWSGTTNPWIEPRLSQWLAEQPPGRRTFCFVNFIDAHEPYLLDPMAAESLREWWKYMQIPQDVLALLAGPTPPSSDDLARLHRLYRSSIAVLDRRIARIVQIYQEAGRWENTLLLLTSDHGQAFGEHGMVWHGVRTDEEMLRVPLLVRFPHGEFGGARGRGWASPMDAAPTVLEAAGVRRNVPLSGSSLRGLVDSERPRPLFAAGDGTEWNRPFMEHLSPRRRTELNLFSIAAYRESTKIVLDALTGRVRGYDLASNPPTELTARELAAPDLEPIVEEARRAGNALLHPSVPSVSAEVDDRLRSWGYG